jgi:hypothetical protein
MHKLLLTDYKVNTIIILNRYSMWGLKKEVIKNDEQKLKGS